MTTRKETRKGGKVVSWWAIPACGHGSRGGFESKAAARDWLISVGEAEGTLGDGGLAQGAFADGGLAQGAPAPAQGAAQGALADGGFAQGAPAPAQGAAQGALAEPRGLA